MFAAKNIYQLFLFPVTPIDALHGTVRKWHSAVRQLHPESSPHIVGRGCFECSSRYRKC
jgi:hypothetical protein